MNNLPYNNLLFLSWVDLQDWLFVLDLASGYTFPESCLCLETGRTLCPPVLLSWYKYMCCSLSPDTYNQTGHCTVTSYPGHDWGDQHSYHYWCELTPLHGTQQGSLICPVCQCSCTLLALCCLKLDYNFCPIVLWPKIRFINFYVCWNIPFQSVFAKERFSRLENRRWRKMSGL